MSERLHGLEAAFSIAPQADNCACRPSHATKCYQRDSSASRSNTLRSTACFQPLAPEISCTPADPNPISRFSNIPP